MIIEIETSSTVLSYVITRMNIVNKETTTQRIAALALY